MSTKILGTLGVRLTALTAEFSKGMDRAGLKLDKFATSARSVAKVSGAMFVGMAIPFGKAISLASDMDEQMNVLTTTFGKMTPEVLKWGKATAKAVGRSEMQMLDYAGSLQSILGPLSGGDEATKKMSMGLAQLAIDLGSFDNAADDEVLMALKAGMIGSLEPMMKYGVVMTQNALNAYAKAKGIKKVVTEMTQAEKTTLRYNFILSQTTLKQGDAAKTAGGFANILKAIKGGFTDVAVSLGKMFLPEATAAARAIKELINRFKGLDPKTKKTIFMIGALTAGFAGIVAAVSLFAAFLPAIISGLSMMARGFVTVAVPLAAISAAIVGLILLVGSLKQAWEGDMLGMRSYTTALANGVSSAADWIVGAWGTATKWIVEAWGTATAAISDLWDTVFDGITEGFNKTVGHIKGVLDWLQSTGLMAMSFVVGDSPEMAHETQKEARKEGGLVGSTAGRVLDKISDATGKALAKISKFSGDYVDKLSFNVSELASNIGTTATEMFTLLGDDLKKALGDGIDTIPGAKDALGGIGDMIDDLVDMFKDKISKAAPAVIAPSVVADGAAGTKGKGTGEAGATAGETTAAAGQSLMSSTGSAGEVAGGAIEGGKSGGVWGAIAGAAVALLKKTEFFGQFVNMLSAAINTMVVSLDQTMKPLVPLVEMFKKIFVIFGKFVASVGSLEPGLMVMAEIMQGVAWAVEKVVGVMIDAWNGLIDRVASAFAKLPWDIGDKIAKKLRASKLGSLDETLREYELDFGERTILYDNFDDSLSDATDAASEFGAALTNVPAGFKTALARFNAIDPGDAGVGLGLGTAAPAMAGDAGGRTVVNNVTINGVNDPEEIYREIKKLEEQEAFMTTGTTIRSGGEQSVHQPK